MPWPINTAYIESSPYDSPENIFGFITWELPFESKIMIGLGILNILYSRCILQHSLHSRRSRQILLRAGVSCINCLQELSSGLFIHAAAPPLACSLPKNKTNRLFAAHNNNSLNQKQTTPLKRCLLLYIGYKTYPSKTTVAPKKS